MSEPTQAAPLASERLRHYMTNTESPGYGGGYNPTEPTQAALVAYACALCGGPITVADNAHGGLITVNVDGHGKAAHRTCPEPAKASEVPTDRPLS